MNDGQRARDLVREAGGDELCGRLEHLDAMRAVLPEPSTTSIAPRMKMPRPTTMSSWWEAGCRCCSPR